jgi:hypothetical protein
MGSPMGDAASRMTADNVERLLVLGRMEASLNSPETDGQVFQYRSSYIVVDWRNRDDDGRRENF